MKLLLTSAGITNASILDAQVVEGAVAIVSEGRWKLFTPIPEVSQ
jgi:hypothetical protein